jgi:hypothetical protein
MLKTNLGPYPVPLAITLVPRARANGSTATGSHAGSIDLVYASAPDPVRPRTLVESCAHWLLDYLVAMASPLRPRKLEAAAHAAGYSRSTLFRARELLGPRIVDTQNRHSPYNHWSLAARPQPLEPAAPPSSSSDPGQGN